MARQYISPRQNIETGYAPVYRWRIPGSCPDFDPFGGLKRKSDMPEFVQIGQPTPLRYIKPLFLLYKNLEFAKIARVDQPLGCRFGSGLMHEL